MLRIISDIHGFYPLYRKLIKEVPASIQLGDLCGNYDKLRNHVNPKKHKFFSGNHDDQDIVPSMPGWMGRYGEFELNGVKGMFIGGGHSIDWAHSLIEEQKTGVRHFWINEELSPDEMDDCFNIYEKIKPQLVISHEACTMINHRIGNPAILEKYGYDRNWSSNTAQFLQKLWGIHEPKMWVNGHMHLCAANQIRNTLFLSLRMYQYIDIDKNLEIC